MNLYQSGMPDTMICGCCRFVTSDFEQFREHRKAPCISVPKTDVKLAIAGMKSHNASAVTSANGNIASIRMRSCVAGKKERNWQCSMCQEACDDAAALIEHALDRHNIRLTKVIE
ncbi:hypothetical protein Tcan_10220 [Toxocara canis]|uniref:C2H2-type domain-containing protein n=1 Tax=Toxocara canis TaxID=6265 RepID=A0A0B2UNL6_TOXCA|nr:hypothetical protein Tcan_10220 [Toxocara canis]